MPKSNTCFLCSNCGYESAKWYGKCPSCGQWNTMSEYHEPKIAARGSVKSTAKTSRLEEVDLIEGELIKSGFPELDRVLGGGIVEGCVVLAGGEPGVGKSTLFLQVADNVAAEGRQVLYVSGEESLKQIRLRASRIGVKNREILLLNETEVNQVVKKIEELNPAVAVIDSIQTLYSASLTGAAGSLSQLKECAARLTAAAKSTGTAVFLIGHVTKEGAIAGPRVLEHMVDTVLYFEGENLNAYRVLRAVKNRFGSTNEISVFEMHANGMQEIENFGKLFIAERERDAAGSVVFCAMEGTRPVLIEIQALVSKTAFNIPRRMTSGADFNRVSLILAVLEKKAGLKLYDQDVYVNVTGGIRLNDPTADLAIALAIVSAYKNRPAGDLIVLGELGLTGQIRAVPQTERRLAESHRLGFSRAIVPKSNAGVKQPKDMRVSFARNIWEALNEAFRPEQ